MVLVARAGRGAEGHARPQIRADQPSTAAAVRVGTAGGARRGHRGAGPARRRVGHGAVGARALRGCETRCSDCSRPRQRRAGGRRILSKQVRARLVRHGLRARLEVRGGRGRRRRGERGGARLLGGGNARGLAAIVDIHVGRVRARVPARAPGGRPVRARLRRGDARVAAASTVAAVAGAGRVAAAIVGARSVRGRTATGDEGPGEEGKPKARMVFMTPHLRNLHAARGRRRFRRFPATLQRTGGTFEWSP